MTSPHNHPSYPPPSPHSTPTPTPQARYAPPPPPPPPFSPFFTLISTPHTTAHKHPIVHYIFADDDIDPTLPSDPSQNQNQNQNPGPSSTDRVIIVDVGATTTDVSAVSLSHDWQVLGVKIEAAPQWAGETAGGGLMLTVEGTDANVVQKRGERERGMGMEELAEVYRERMELLKRVVEFGGGGGGGGGGQTA